jgi:choline-sulfatase
MSRIPRREFLELSGLIGAGLAALPLACPVATQAEPSRVRPNILVFFTDDHGQWAQRCYGNSELLTPNMDRLAARGTRMTRAFTPSPVCSPARASFFTGRMPSQHGIHDWLEESTDALTHPGLTDQTLISQPLKRAGYYTGLVGKWHCGREQEPHPGFDYWFSYWVSQYPHAGVQRFSDCGRLVTEEGPQSPLLTRRAIDFLRDHHRQEGIDGKPFFLFVSYVDTHGPHKDAPEDLVGQYRSAMFRDIPAEKFADCHGKPLQPVNKNHAIECQQRMEYYAAVSSVDREMGKVIAELEASGQMKNTLIVYTSDHGLNCGQHGIWEKGNATIPQNFFEESILVSCTLSWPAGGIRQNVVCDDLVSHCDLWATLLEIAGATPDTQTAARINSPGLSYLPQLRGKRVQAWRQTMICEFGNARMARTDRYKLIKRYPYAGRTYPDELYDLREDPRETVNRHDDASLKEVIHDLSAEMDQFFVKYTVPGRSGLALERQPECNPESPWLLASK